MWINQHGEVVSEVLEDKPDDAVWLDDDDLPTEPTHTEEDLSWVPEWLLKQQLHVDAEEKALKCQFKLRLSEISSRRKYLDFAYLGTAEKIVQGDLANQKGKKKSVRYALGTCGYRKNTSVVVVDEELALDWAEENCEDAVKWKRSLLKSALPNKGAGVPGVEAPTGDVFFVRPSLK